MILRIGLLLAVLLACPGLAKEDAAQRIKNVVVIMLENRSFDHLLGFNPATGLDGLKGDERNYYNVSNPSQGYATVGQNPKEHMEFDPSHSVSSTRQQVFGSDPTTQWPCPMNGFVENAVHKSGNKAMAPEVMQMYNPKTAPVINTLANEYALFDRWYSSVPGPTQVNRFYLHSATSHGMDYNDVPEMLAGMPQRTWYENLRDAGIEWEVYSQLISGTLFFKWMRKPENLVRQQTWDTFLRKAREGSLPQYSFIEPRYLDDIAFPATDQHPTHAVYDGEMMLKETYEAIRNGPQWNETLLLVTYDEHGGFFDHVPPPNSNVPNPDGLVSRTFSFDRLGVRVPTIAISPWIKKGHIEHEPTGPGATHYDHTSTLATLKKLWNIPSYLTKRDAWASTYEHLWSELETPRTDCPTTMPTPPKLSDYVFDHGSGPVNDLGQEMVILAGGLLGKNMTGDEFGTEREASEFIQWARDQVFARVGHFPYQNDLTRVEEITVKKK